MRGGKNLPVTFADSLIEEAITELPVGKAEADRGEVPGGFRGAAHRRGRRVAASGARSLAVAAKLARIYLPAQIVFLNALRRTAPARCTANSCANGLKLEA